MLPHSTIPTGHAACACTERRCATTLASRRPKSRSGPRTRAPSGLAVWALATTALGPTLLAPPSSALAESSPATLATLATLEGPRLETTVVGLEVLGASPRQRLRIEDLDILMGSDDERALPLLRLLEVLQVEVTHSNSVVAFQPDGADPVSLDWGEGIVTRAGSPDSVRVPAAITAGISDVTERPEFYVAEPVMAGLLDIDIEWDPMIFGYRFRPRHELRVFRQAVQNIQLLLSGAGVTATRSALPSLLPTAQGRPSIAPRLRFAQLQVQSSATARNEDDPWSGTLAPPRIKVWADALGGRATATLVQRVRSPNEGLHLDRGSWTLGLGQSEFVLGHSNLGFSQLVFPALGLVGARWNGILGASSSRNGSDRSQLGQKRVYTPVHVVRGYAPMGSTVTLLINGRVIDEQEVEVVPSAPVGEGYYEFEGINLLTSRVNEIRVSVASPNGVVEEETLGNLLGSSDLLEQGAITILASAGGRRQLSSDGLEPQGSFVGGRLDFGVANGLTLGTSFAKQDGIYDYDQDPVVETVVRDLRPRESDHAGARIVWRPRAQWIVRLNTASSRNGASSPWRTATRTEAEIHTGWLRLHPFAFRYGTSFFDGQSEDLKDVAGAGVSLQWRGRSGDQVSLSGSRLTDNLDGHLARTTRLRKLGSSVSLRRILPKSTVTLASSVIWIDEAPIGQVYSLGLGSRIGGWMLRSRLQFGDDIRREVRNLSDGSETLFERSLRLNGRSLGGASSSYPSRNHRVEMRRSLGSTWHLAIGHRSSGDIERTQADLVRRAAVTDRLQWRLTPGLDWDRESAFFEGRAELFLDETRQNRLELDAALDREEWSLRISLRALLSYGFVSHRPIRIVDRRTNLDAGGVRGRVFLDRNANGVLDRGEPGLEEVEVASDLGRPTTTGTDGLFVFSNGAQKRHARISLLEKSLPAYYTVTHGTQEALIWPGGFTEINLGVVEFGSVSGLIQTEDAAGLIEGLNGVRVQLLNSRGEVTGSSVTARDGSYYIGEVRPGRQTVRIDEETLPTGIVFDPISRVVSPGIEGSLDLEGLDFLGTTPERESEKTQPQEIEYKIFR